MDLDRVAHVLDFWFFELSAEAWFKKDETLDELIRTRFLSDYEQLADTVPVDTLVSKPETALASLITLDQFPRNMFRGTARMFEGDAKALRLAHEVRAKGLDRQIEPARRLFCYLPFEHSEALADQDLSVALFERLGDPLYLRYAKDHRDIITRFGRFPRRNALLDRPSSAEELAFLAQPGSSF
jgi:uncharacterized protein (DUF924 family)